MFSSIGSGFRNAFNKIKGKNTEKESEDEDGSTAEVKV